MKKMVIVLLGLLSAACVGTSQTSNFYTLKSYNNATETTVYNLKSSIGVDDVVISSYLDKPQIVTTDTNSMELKSSEFNRWSEPLSHIIQRTLANDLAAYLPKAMVKAKSDSREDFKYLVAVEVNQFDGSWNDNAVLDAWWQIKNEQGNILLKERTRLQKPMGKTYLNLVEAQSQLINELAQLIAARLAEKNLR